MALSIASRSAVNFRIQRIHALATATPSSSAPAGRLDLVQSFDRRAPSVCLRYFSTSSAAFAESTTAGPKQDVGGKAGAPGSCSAEFRRRPDDLQPALRHGNLVHGLVFRAAT